MRTKVSGPTAFNYLQVFLDPGESFVSESGAMVRMTAGVSLDITTRSKGRGGILASLGRLAAGDTFFMANYRAGAAPGEVVIAPTHLGSVHVIHMDGAHTWQCAGSSYLASGPDVGLETRWQGLKRGFLSGEGLFYIKCTGTGMLALNAFGCIEEIPVNGDYVVDTGHVVAFEDSLTYDITKAGGSWLQSFFAGEGFVMQFKGTGRLLVQSHNPQEFGAAVGPSLPPRA